jgi:hypothetical protein
MEEKYKILPVFLEKYGLKMEWFYSVSIYPGSITLQGKFNSKIILKECYKEHNVDSSGNLIAEFNFIPNEEIPEINFNIRIVLTD